jgi:hypothetical protein
VANNLALYTPQQRKQAARARELQIIAGLQSTARTAELLKSIDNAGVTAKDLARADALAGKPLAKVRGSTKQHGQTVARVEVEEPRLLDNREESGWFEIDLLYIQGLASVFDRSTATSWLCHVSISTRQHDGGNR